MALENKKSLLQPESIEAQQYRLKNSNLAARLDQSISISNQQSSAVGAAPTRPSVLAPSTPPTPLPAESNATVSSTVPGGSPTPIPSPANPAGSPTNSPSAPTQEIVYKTIAADFDGSFYFTASNADLGIAAISGSAYSYGIMFKPDSLKAGHDQTLFHTYSGSFQSCSIDISLLAGGNIALRYRNNGGSRMYRFKYGSWVEGLSGKDGNGYTYIQLNRSTTNRVGPVSADHKFYISGQNRVLGTKTTNSIGIFSGDFNVSNNDHFYIGGTAAQDGINFSGSIAWITFDKKGLPAGNVSQLKNRDETVTRFRDSNWVRSYTFTNNAATASIEYTGSAATTQVPLGMNVHSSSYTYVAGRE